MVLALPLLFLAMSACAAKSPTLAAVIVPVADLRSDQSLPEPGKSDDKQQTQLLSGETVEVVKSSGDWVFVNAIEQLEYTTNNRWEGYPGWVLKSSLQTGRRGTGQHLQSSDPGGARKILSNADEYLGSSYVWGGLSASKDAPNTRLAGLDCSGLTHIAYRKNGIAIPRDSHEQWMKAKPIEPQNLQPGDLVFSAKSSNPSKIVHVSLYTGDGMLIEAPQTGMLVHKISFKEKYGVSLKDSKNGLTAGDRVLYFGTFLH